MVEEGLRLLRILPERFDEGVPRGAQTWEIPLHTPDILGSAYLVKAFALGYELTGDPSYLDAARYWAWTGVPFVYLVNPTTASGPGAVGPFATIPVLGATNWIAPNWIGLPVQWCGLVYAESLARLARHDPNGPWQTLADGIAASGIVQTYPLDHPHHGLLPDSFNLRPSRATRPTSTPRRCSRWPSACWPGEPGAIPYEFRALRQSGLWVHAPGPWRRSRTPRARSGSPSGPGALDPRSWWSTAWREAPHFVRINGQPIAFDPPPPVPSRPRHPDPSARGRQAGGG